MEGGWTAIYVSLDDHQQQPVAGAVVEVRSTTGDRTLGWGLTDERGEGVIPLLNIPQLKEVELDEDGDGEEETSVVTAITKVKLTLIADPDQPWPADPQKIKAKRQELKSLTPDEIIELKTGMVVHRRLTLPLN